MVGETLRNLLMIAWLLPLAGFAVEIFGGFWGSRKSRVAAWMSVACIGIGFVCSLSALLIWGGSNKWTVLHVADAHSAAHTDEVHGTESHSDPAHAEHSDTEADHAHAAGSADSHTSPDSHTSHEPPTKRGQTVFSGTLYYLARFGSLDISLDYYIDSLTLVMFTMVTFIATCIHLFAMGYKIGRASCRERV